MFHQKAVGVVVLIIHLVILILDKPITLDQNNSYLVGLEEIETMNYSWYNMSEQYKKIQFVMEFYQMKKMRLKKLKILLELFIMPLNSYQEVIVMIM